MDLNGISENSKYIRESLDFASRICNAMKLYAYVVTASVDKALNVESQGGWCGEIPLDLSSRAPHVAHGKMGELVLLEGGLDGKLVMTPTQNELSYRWMGGVAQNGWIIAVSKLAQEHDRLLALMILYNRVHKPLKLHHVGYRFDKPISYRLANQLYENGLNRDADDHNRMYFPQKEGHYIEHQWFPYGPHDIAGHWDFVTEDPEDFLTFIANAYGQEPLLFGDNGTNDPAGAVWVAGSDESILGVMARRTWWKVEEE